MKKDTPSSVAPNPTRISQGPMATKPKLGEEILTVKVSTRMFRYLQDIAKGIGCTVEELIQKWIMKGLREQ